MPTKPKPLTKIHPWLKLITGKKNSPGQRLAPGHCSQGAKVRGSPVSAASTKSTAMEASTTEPATVEVAKPSAGPHPTSMESPSSVSAAKAGYGMIVEAVSNRRRTRSVEVMIAAEAAIVTRVPHHQR